MGRKSTYSDEAAELICNQIADGIPLREICRQPNMPAWRTVYDWQAENAEFAARFARARDIGADAIAEKALEIISTPPERTLTQHGDKIDAGYVQWQRAQADFYLKLLSKWNPKKYGDKIDLTSSDGSMTPAALNAENLSDEALKELMEAKNGRANK